MKLETYTDFVQSVTSNEANNTQALVERLVELDKLTDVNLTLLLNSSVGMVAEAGEFSDIPKKIFWQGKPMDEQTQFHMKRELGDVIFYWFNACRALNLDPEEVILENINKLSSRYKDGFSAEMSNNRKKHDI